MNSFSVGWMTALCQPDQKIVLLIPGSNEEFTIELYKEELGKSYLKIDLFLCNVSNVDDAAISITPQSSYNIQGYFCQNSCYREGKEFFGQSQVYCTISQRSRLSFIKNIVILRRII